MRDRDRSLTNLAQRAAIQLLRLVPGTAALRWKRDLRDSFWLAEADAAIVSFPKSGRTFVRAMLARLYQRRFGIDERNLLAFPGFRGAPANVPRVLFTHAGDAMRTPDGIAIDGDAYAHAKLVILARHPGDIAVSRFHHLRHRSADRARRRLAEQPLASFVWTAQGGIASIVAFLNRFASMPRITIVRYEDFLTKPQTTLRRLAGAIGLAVDDADIADAVEFGSFDNLKKCEREGYFRSSRLRPAKAGDAQSFKVRSGGSGGYRAQLNKDEADRIDFYVAAHLDPVFGYSSKPRTRKGRLEQ